MPSPILNKFGEHYDVFPICGSNERSVSHVFFNLLGDFLIR